MLSICPMAGSHSAKGLSYFFFMHFVKMRLPHFFNQTRKIYFKHGLSFQSTFIWYVPTHKTSRSGCVSGVLVYFHCSCWERPPW